MLLSPLQASDAALGLAPTVIELLLARAKILQHAGDAVGAAVVCDSARRCDLADRYTNSMAVKALFAAGEMELAEQTALLFTRDGDQVCVCFLCVCVMCERQREQGRGDCGQVQQCVWCSCLIRGL